MALHSKDQLERNHEVCTSHNSLLTTSNPLFYNVDILSRLPPYSTNSYDQDAQLLLQNLSYCAGRLKFGIHSSFRSFDQHIRTDEQSCDHARRSGACNPGQLSHSPHTVCHELISEPSPSSVGHVIRTRRRKIGGVIEARICVVCGEAASGYNFDCLTCESCKAFFRRNVLRSKDKIKACVRDGGCNIEGVQRKHCPSCRLGKCLAVGMKKELILPPEKLEHRAKPKRRKRHLVAADADNDDNEDDHANEIPHHAFPLSTSAVSPKSTIHHCHFDEDSAREITASKTLYTLFPDMAGPRCAPGSVMDVCGLADSWATASTVKSQPTLTPNSATRNGWAPDFSISSYRVAPTLSPRVAASSPCPFFPGTSRAGFCPKTAQSSHLPPLNGKLQRSSWCQPALSSGPTAPSETTTVSNVKRYSINVSGLLHPHQCCYRNSRSLCYHSTCRRAFVKQYRRRHLSDHLSGPQLLPLEMERPDKYLHMCLSDCVQRIREPFSPEELTYTLAAPSLEQEYNRMDASIRRIIRVVRMLPFFDYLEKPAQLGLLRANVYGMVVLYSSFFFDRNIQKLLYPIKHPDGALSVSAVSVLDDPRAPASVGGCVDKSTLFVDRSSLLAFDGVKEDFEVYKANTLAAFNHLDELAGADDILRMVLLAIKLFSEDGLSENLRSVVMLSKRVYLVFLWTYLRWRAGPRHLREATELFARLHLAFIDLRALELRMTEFTKFVSLESLSPLMREICSFKQTHKHSRCDHY